MAWAWEAWRSPKALAYAENRTDQAVSFKEKRDILLALLPEVPSVPAPVRNFLLGMFSNGDITLLDEVVDELNHLSTAAGGPRLCRRRSPVPWS